jgi:UDP-N-acetylmuramyl pentapeptide synthase
MLTYQDVSSLFPKKAGIVEQTIQFCTVSTHAGDKQPKGLFIPCFEGSGALQEAIANGAIAAVWQENHPVPAYTPNHFPLFFTEDLLKGLEDIMKLYLDYLPHHEEKMGKTNFIFQRSELLNEKESTYDIAVMAEKINHFYSDQSKAGEE